MKSPFQKHSAGTAESGFMWQNKRVRTPTVLQMEASECGAAALGMILGTFGRIVPLEELRVKCGVSRDGSKASNMLRAARGYGLDAKGFKLELEDIRKHALPMILFWNFNHFVVLEGIKKNRVFINNPARGRETVTWKEFDRSFTGIALTFTPRAGFEKGGRKRSVARAIGRRLAGSRTALTYVVLAGLFLVIPGLIIPTFSKIFVDDILIGKMEGWLRPLLLAMGVTALLRAVLIWFQQHYLLRFNTKIALADSARFFRHVLHLPIEFFGQRMAGDIGSRIQLNDKMAHLLSGELATTILNLVMIVFYAILMFSYDVLLTLAAVFTAALNLVALKLISERRTVLNQRLQMERGKLMGITMNGLQMIETLKASGAESDYFSQWAGQQAKVVNTHQEMAVPSQILSVVPPLLMTLNGVLILVLGGFRVMDGHLTIGMLVAFQSLMSSFMRPVNQLVSLGGKLQEVRADLDRLDDVLFYNSDARDSDQGRPPGTRSEESPESGPVKLEGALELNHITFGYSRLADPLIQDFNLKLEPGSRVALVGKTGSGKSTLAKLVTGLYEPWEGEVLLDGRPRRDISPDIRNNSLAMVDQDIFLFEGTVRDNLTMWDASASDHNLSQATMDAGIHDEITARAGGFSSPVEEGGANFSGGERQRLEIARALVNDPSILVLDEATSALDPETEALVDSHLRRRGCTCLIIAHRLSTIRDSDEIIVLDQGRVVQRGTHEELKKQDGLYGRLIKAH